MSEKRKKSADEITGRLQIKMAFEELFDAIDEKAGEELDAEKASELRSTCEDYQKQILGAFDKVADEVAAGDFSPEEEEEKILDAVYSVMPLLKEINTIQETLKIE